MDVDKKKIKALLKKLKDGRNVNIRDLRNKLGEQAVTEYESEWQLEQETRLKVEDKPQIIKDYEALLKRADFSENKADGIKISSRDKKDLYNRNSQVRLRNTAESLYEDALIKAEEIVTANPSYRIWFDRELDFTPNGDLYTSSCKVPRIVTSRSRNKLTSVKAPTKQDVKKSLLQRYLDNSHIKELSKADAIKLKDMLQKLKQRKD
jgi:hypothetical protein